MPENNSKSTNKSPRRNPNKNPNIKNNPRSKKTNTFDPNHVPRRVIIDALKIAFAYIPEAEDITQEMFDDDYKLVKEEQSIVEKTLVSLGVNIDELYKEMGTKTAI
jgi:hypothetical protein